MAMRFTDERGVQYVYDPKLHCGATNFNTFCIIGPEHAGDHWDGSQDWHRASFSYAETGQEVE